MNSLAMEDFSPQELDTLQRVCREAEGVNNVIDITSFRRPLNADIVYEAAGRISPLYLGNKERFTEPLQTLHNMLVFASTSPSLEKAVDALELALLEDGSQIQPRAYMLKTKEIARSLNNPQYSAEE